MANRNTAHTKNRTSDELLIASPPRSRRVILRQIAKRKATEQRTEASAQANNGVLKLPDRPKVTLDNYKPNRKQLMFHQSGAINRERLLKAGNQLGKTTSGGVETAFHLLGRYPDWWQGRRFTHPIRAWAGSDGFEVTRDGVQRILVGDPKLRESWGSGLIPKKDIVSWKLRRGTPDALDNIVVRHVSGGLSTLGFKSFDQGREKWQGETLDLVWFDEEPDIDIYWEGLTRTNATNGLVLLTLTPLKGMTELMQLYAKCPGFWDVGELSGQSGQ